MIQSSTSSLLGRFCRPRLVLRTVQRLRLFSNDTDVSWIPPERPLAGDVGQSDLYPHVQTTDWLQTRRATLVTPEQGDKHKQELAEIPVKRHTLLSVTEIRRCLLALGGQDLTYILDDAENPRMGGAYGIVIVTHNSPVVRKTLAEALVRQMRRRDLHETGVVGAAHGVETTEDPNEPWLVVDCESYVVHILNEYTRKALNLEKLWRGHDALHRLDTNDDDAVDDYVADNPVPEHYPVQSPSISDTYQKLEKLRLPKSQRRRR